MQATGLHSTQLPAAVRARPNERDQQAQKIAMETFSSNKRRRLPEAKMDPSPASLINDDEVLVALPPLSPSHIDNGIFSKSLDELTMVICRIKPSI